MFRFAAFFLLLVALIEWPGSTIALRAADSPENPEQIIFRKPLQDGSEIVAIRSAALPSSQLKGDAKSLLDRNNLQDLTALHQVRIELRSLAAPFDHTQVNAKLTRPKENQIDLEITDNRLLAAPVTHFTQTGTEWKFLPAAIK